MDQFEDKVTIVTGGASGLGRALCEELGRRRAVVIVADINEAGAQQTASDLARLGVQAAAIRLDVA